MRAARLRNRRLTVGGGQHRGSVRASRQAVLGSILSFPEDLFWENALNVDGIYFMLCFELDRTGALNNVNETSNYLTKSELLDCEKEEHSLEGSSSKCRGSVCGSLNYANLSDRMPVWRHKTLSCCTFNAPVRFQKSELTRLLTTLAYLCL